MTENDRELDLTMGDLAAENRTLKEQLDLYRQHNEDLLMKLADQDHNNDLDIQDGRRFQRMVRAAVEGDEEFLDLLQLANPEPKSLIEIRTAIDAAMLKERQRVNG